jgi:hypothetical protein
MHETCLPHGPSGTQYQPPPAYEAGLESPSPPVLLVRPVDEQNTVHQRACGKFEDGSERTDNSVKANATAFLQWRAGGICSPVVC